jgi:putative heme transporter
MTQRRVSPVNWGRWAWSLIGTGVVVIAVVFAASRVSLILTPIVLALFPAALLHPLAAAVRRSRMPNALGALLIMVGLLAVLATTAYLVIPALADQAPQLASAIADGLGRIDNAVDWSRMPGNFTGLSDLGSQAATSLQSSGLLTQGLGLAAAVGDFAAGTVLTLVILFFYLKDGRRIWYGVADFVPATHRDEVDLLAWRSFQTVGAFLRGQLLVALIDAVFIGLGLLLLGVPLVLPLAALVFFGGLFPIIGAFLSGTAAVVVALADGGPVTALLVLGVVLLVQQLEGHVLAPLIQGHIIALHPLVIILALTTGGVLMGVLGAFLGVPVAAVIARIVDHFRGQDLDAGYGPRPAPDVT